MGNYTGNLKLYKADPVTDGNDTFNIDTMLNENWDKIDLAAIPASTTQYGHTKLYSGIDSDSESLAATPKAVKAGIAAAKQIVSEDGTVYEWGIDAGGLYIMEVQK